jgi:hypothetical protein
MSRPKSSGAGLVDLVLSAYNSRTLRQHSSALSVNNQTLGHIQVGVEFTHDYLGHIDSKIDLLNQNQMETALIAIQNSLQTQEVITGLVGIKSEVEKLSNNTWSILAKMNDFERKEEILGTLRLFLIEVEEELERIEEISHDYPVFSSVLSEDLHNLIVRNEVTIDKFKRMHNVDDIKWAKSVIRTVHRQKEEAEVRLNSDKSFSNDYKIFKTSVDIIIRIENEIEPLLKALKSIKTQFIKQSNLLKKLEDSSVLSDIEFHSRKIVENDPQIKELRILEKNPGDFYRDKIQREFEHAIANLTLPNFTGYDGMKKIAQIKRSKTANLKKKMEQDLEALAENPRLQEIQNSIERRIKQLKVEVVALRLAREGEANDLRLAKDKYSAYQKNLENNLEQIYQREQDIVENWQILTNYLPNNSIDLKDLDTSVESPNSKDL